MRHSLSSERSRDEAVSATRQRVAALLGLLALGFLLGHVHPAHGVATDADNAPAVSDDDAHHEHSYHVAVDTAPCVGCRSCDELPIAAARQASPIPTNLTAQSLPERVRGASRAPFSGLPATRAPPII